MGPIKKDQKKLKKMLTAAYYGKEKAAINERWQIRVMRHVRSLGPLNVKTSYLELFEGLVWKLAPVACLLILVLTIILTKLDFVSEYEIAKAFMEDPLDFSLFHFLQTS
jgi:hypothetical protein